MLRDIPQHSNALRPADTLHGAMNSPFCNVALAVPLRTTFTYAVPEPMRGTVHAGSRVLVPFRKKSLVGVVVEIVKTAPDCTKVREIVRVLDLVPALTPKLIELANWIASYYLAPIGDVFRSMLPPLTELRLQSHIVLTESGRQASESLSGGELSHGLTGKEAVFLAKLKEKKSAILLKSQAKLGLDVPSLQRLQRLGLIDIRESIQSKKRKTQRVIAWKVAPAGEEAAKPLGEKEEKIRMLLETQRGPLPLTQLLRLANVTRSLIERMLRDALLESWEEPLDPAEDPFDVGYSPPAHELNAEQEAALKGIRARFELGAFGVQLLHGVTGSGKRRCICVPSRRRSLAEGMQSYWCRKSL